jgi:hypothetical protein
MLLPSVDDAEDWGALPYPYVQVMSGIDKYFNVLDVGMLE